MLVVWCNEDQSAAAQIEIGKDASVQGAIVAVNRSIRDREKGSISIAKVAEVTRLRLR